MVLPPISRPTSSLRDTSPAAGSRRFVVEPGEDGGVPAQLMGLMVVHGAQAGGFSPISIYGGIVNGVVDKSGLPGNETAIFQSRIGAVGMVAVSSTVVDRSPISTNGALMPANAQGVDKDVFFRKPLAYGGVVVVVAPIATWLLLIVPGWL